MIFNDRVKKYIESDLFYEQLKEDATVCFLYELCQSLVLEDLTKEALQYVEEIKQGKRYEKPSVNMDDFQKFRKRLETSKLMNDRKKMPLEDNLIDLMFNDYVTLCDHEQNGAPCDFDDDYVAKIKLYHNIINALNKKDPNIFENCFRPFMKQSDSIEESQEHSKKG